MALDPELLSVLVCPQTHQPLRYIPAQGADPECLLSEQASLLYRVEDGLPILLVEEARPLSAAQMTALCQRADKAAAG